MKNQDYCVVHGGILWVRPYETIISSVWFVNHWLVCLHLLMLCISPVSDVSNVLQYHGTVVKTIRQLWLASSINIKAAYPKRSPNKLLLAEAPLTFCLKKKEEGNKLIFHNVCTCIVWLYVGFLLSFYSCHFQCVILPTGQGRYGAEARWED